MSTIDVNRNTPFPPASPTTITGAVYEFMKGQPFNNVLTVALLGCIVSAAYGVYLSIPAHLKTIQDGYERIEAVHERVSKAQLDSHEKTVQTLAASLREDRDNDRKHQREMLDLIIKNKLGSSITE